MDRLPAKVGSTPVKGGQLGSRMAMPTGADDTAGRSPGDPPLLILHSSPWRRMSDPIDGAVRVRHDRPLLTDAKVDTTAGVGLAWTTLGMNDDHADRDEQSTTMLAEGH
jgi:hypothetical protein